MDPPAPRLRRDRLERIAVEAAVSAALENMQAARLPLQNYFGANEATIVERSETSLSISLSEDRSKP
jgi:hypothetical protein